MKRTLSIIIAASIMAMSCVHTRSPSISVSVHAVPIDAVSGILAAFEKHQVVALDEGAHGNVQAHVFRLSLIRDPRFATTVNDIVVEFGAAQNQSVIDRFVNGEDVPLSELKKVWLDTTQIFPVWDVPIYEEFYRAVREVNLTLPKEKRIRILLGDPPVDWDKAAEIASRQDRDGPAAGLIKR